MKKLFLCIILFICITGASLFAWDPSYFLTYPKCANDDKWIFNFGIGLHFPSDFGSNDYIYIMPLRVSFDKNVPIGDNKLPFFFGGVVGYNGEGWKNDWFTHKISAGFRAGYHFNFDIDNLDVYAVTTAGWTFFSHTNDNAPRSNRAGRLCFGSNLGARYFISENFGFWAEAGFNPFSWFDIGLTWKF